MAAHRKILGFALVVLAMLASARPAHADGTAWTDAISREASVYAGSPSGFVAPTDAVSREVSVYAGSPNGFIAPTDALSREVSVYAGSPSGFAAPTDAVSREVSVYAGSPSGFAAPADAVSREVSVYAGSPSGFAAPTDAVSREVSVYAGTRDYKALEATLTPQAAIDAGAAWRRVGTTPWLASGVTEVDNLTTGSCTVEFNSIFGWISPENQTVTISDDLATSISATYVQLVGSLTVTLAPQAAINAGAAWRRVGTTPWLDDGVTENDVPIGNHTVEFKVVDGWTTPASQLVTLFPSLTTTLPATYIIYARVDNNFWTAYE